MKKYKIKVETLAINKIPITKMQGGIPVFDLISNEIQLPDDAVGITVLGLVTLKPKGQNGKLQIGDDEKYLCNLGYLIPVLEVVK